MTLVTSSAIFFCHSLGWGMLPFYFLTDPRETGTGLNKLITGISLGALALGALLHGVHGSFLSAKGGCYFLGMLALLVMFLGHHSSKLLCGVGIGAMTSLFVLSADSAKELLFILSSAALLGTVTYAMVLGHWYLVTPKLSNFPLLRAFACMGGLLVVKSALSGYGFVVGVSIPDSFGQILIAMRILWGYLVVGGMGWFGYRLVKMRSIQSATGILYAMTFAVFIGELASHYLHSHYGIWT